jgi:hypothetical protein
VLVEEKYLLEALESGDKAASAEEVPQARQRIAEGKTAAQKFACSINNSTKRAPRLWRVYLRARSPAPLTGVTPEIAQEILIRIADG